MDNIKRQFHYDSSITVNRVISVIVHLQLDSRYVETREYELGEPGNEVENDASAINKDHHIVAGFSAFNIKIATSSALYFVEFNM